MAEAKAEDPVSYRHKICDEEDELELFAVELMLNMMKHFSNANIVVMPKLPRPSKYYSITILKSVALAWRITRSIFAQRFRKAFRFMCRGRHELFSYSTYQADELFDRMKPHAQLIYLAAYCYELSNFLSRNGQEGYIYVAYTLFTTIWSHLYQEKFDRAGGWQYAERELKPYERVLKPLEDIFFPGYLYSFNDLVTIQSEYQIVKERNRNPGHKPLKLEIRSSFGNAGGRMRQRMVTSEDRELDFLDSILDFNNLKFLFKMPVFPPEKLIGYLEKRAKRAGKYKGRDDLLKFYNLEESETLPNIPFMSGSEDLTLSTPPATGSEVLTPCTPPLSGSELLSPSTPPASGSETLTPSKQAKPSSEHLTQITPPVPGSEVLTPRTPPMSGSDLLSPSTPPASDCETSTPSKQTKTSSENSTQSTPPAPGSQVLTPRTPPLSGSEFLAPSTPPASGFKTLTSSKQPVPSSENLAQSMQPVSSSQVSILDTSPSSDSQVLAQSTPPVSSSEILSRRSARHYAVVYRSIIRLFSFLAYDVPDLIDIEAVSKNQSAKEETVAEEEPTTTAGGAKPKQKKTGAKDGKSPTTNCDTKSKTNAKVKTDDQLGKKKQFENSKSPNLKAAEIHPESPTSQLTKCDTKPKTKTKLKSDDQSAKKKQFETLKSPNSKSVAGQPGSPTGQAANCGAKPKTNTKLKPDEQSVKTKQFQASKSPNKKYVGDELSSKSAVVQPESPTGQATNCGTKSKTNVKVKPNDRSAKKKQCETSKSPNSKSVEIQPESLTGQSTKCDTKSKTKTKLESDDQLARKKQFETSESPNKKYVGDEPSSKSAVVQSETSECSVANYAAKPKTNTKLKSDDQSVKKKQCETSKSQSSTSVQPESPAGQSTNFDPKPKTNTKLKSDDQQEKKKQFKMPKSQSAKSAQEKSSSKFEAVRPETSTDLTINCDTGLEMNKLKPEDQLAKERQFETSKSPNAKSERDESSSKFAGVETESSDPAIKDPATKSGTKTKTNAKVKPENLSAKKKQLETSVSPNSKSAGVAQESPTGQAKKCVTKPKANTKLKSDGQSAKKKL